MYKDISMFWGMLGVFFWWDVVFIGLMAMNRWV